MLVRSGGLEEHEFVAASSSGTGLHSGEQESLLLDESEDLLWFCDLKRIPTDPVLDVVPGRHAPLGKAPTPSAEGVAETIYKGMVRSRVQLEAQSEAVREKINLAITESASRFEINGRIEIPMPALINRAQKP